MDRIDLSQHGSNFHINDVNSEQNNILPFDYLPHARQPREVNMDRLKVFIDEDPRLIKRCDKTTWRWTSSTSLPFFIRAVATNMES